MSTATTTEPTTSPHTTNRTTTQLERSAAQRLRTATALAGLAYGGFSLFRRRRAR